MSSHSASLIGPSHLKSWLASQPYPFVVTRVRAKLSSHLASLIGPSQKVLKPWRLLNIEVFSPNIEPCKSRYSTIYKKTRFGQSIWDKFNNLQEDKIWAKKHMGLIQQSTRRQDLGKGYGDKVRCYWEHVEEHLEN